MEYSHDDMWKAYTMSLSPIQVFLRLRDQFAQLPGDQVMIQRVIVWTLGFVAMILVANNHYVHRFDLSYEICYAAIRGREHDGKIIRTKTLECNLLVVDKHYSNISQLNPISECTNW